MWTVTLPPEGVAGLLELDTWHRFQTAIRHELVRLLERRGHVPLVVAAVEMHPNRSREQGMPIPHIHVLLRNRSHRCGKWWIRTEEFDRIIRAAARAAGLNPQGWERSGNLTAIKQSARAYVTKYLTKPSQFEAAVGHFELVPRQWWFMSRALLDRVKAAEVEVPPDFLAWLGAHWRDAGHRAPCTVSEFEDLPPKVPRTFMVRFRSPACLWRLWEAFEIAHIRWE